MEQKTFPLLEELNEKEGRLLCDCISFFSDWDDMSEDQRLARTADLKSKLNSMRDLYVEAGLGTGPCDMAESAIKGLIQLLKEL